MSLTSYISPSRKYNHQIKLYHLQLQKRIQTKSTIVASNMFVEEEFDVIKKDVKDLKILDSFES
jgi:hypothetical protein